MSDNQPGAQRDHRLEDILAYKQGFLTEAEKAEVEQHLRDCDACQRTLEEVSLFLPAMQKALTQPEPSSEAMLAKAKATLRARPPKPAPFFTRVRVALLAFGAAAASTIFIVLQPLLQGPAVMAKGDHQKPVGGMVSAPHRPGWVPDFDVDGGPDGGDLLDAGDPLDEGQAQ